MKNLFLSILLAVVPLLTMAQESGEPPTDVKSKFVSYQFSLTTQHVWRGLTSGKTPCIESTLEFNFTPHFKFGLWGTTTLDDSYREIDMYFTYHKPRFSLTIYDYYSPADSRFRWNEFFDYKTHSTQHFIDIIAVYRLRNIPLQITAATIFHGNDYYEDGKQAYSSYFELDYAFPFEFITPHVFLGVNPTGNFYHDKFSVINLGVMATKPLKITDTYSIPIQAKLSGNPAAKAIYFNVSMAF